MMRVLDANTPPAIPEVSIKDMDMALGFLKRAGRFEKELSHYMPGDINAMEMVDIKILVGLVYVGLLDNFHADVCAGRAKG